MDTFEIVDRLVEKVEAASERVKRGELTVLQAATSLGMMPFEFEALRARVRDRVKSGRERTRE